jgi:hypothetical protein
MQFDLTHGNKLVTISFLLISTKQIHYNTIRLQPLKAEKSSLPNTSKVSS